MPVRGLVLGISVKNINYNNCLTNHIFVGCYSLRQVKGFNLALLVISFHFFTHLKRCIDKLFHWNPVVHKQLINDAHPQNRDPMLLRKHRQRRTGQRRIQENPPPRAQFCIPVLAVLDVQHDAQQKEQTCPNISSSNDSSHCFRMYRVCSKQQTSHKGWYWTSEEYHGCHLGEGCRCQRVQKHVGEVVAPWIEASQPVVQTKRQDADGSVGLVGSAVGEWGAPEVVLEERGQRGGWQEILIGLDSSTGRK